MDATVPASEAEIIVLDYESTGSLQGYPNEPWQIGMISIRRGAVDPDSIRMPRAGTIFSGRRWFARLPCRSCGEASAAA